MLVTNSPAATLVLAFSASALPPFSLSIRTILFTFSGSPVRHSHIPRTSAVSSPLARSSTAGTNGKDESNTSTVRSFDPSLQITIS